MRKLLLTTGLIIIGHAASAADCSDLGVDNAYLLKHFCTELQGIIGDTASGTRSMSDTTSNNGDAGALEFDWATIGILRDAYRADPQTTLELIERIRNAGGLLNE